MSVVRTWMTKNKSDRRHNKGCHLKGQYNVTFSYTKGLSKIPQVSCHRCKKAIKIASKSVRSFSVRENWALYELGWQRIKATDCIIKVVILRGNTTWRSLALRDWACKQINAWQPLLPSAKGLSFTFIFYLMQESWWSSPFPFSFYPLASTSCWKDPDTYIQLDVS